LATQPVAQRLDINGDIRKLWQRADG